MKNKWYEDNDGNNSGKRIIGTLLIAYAVIIVTVFIIRNIDIPENISSIIQSMLYSGGIMITGGVVEKFAKK